MMTVNDEEKTSLVPAGLADTLAAVERVARSLNLEQTLADYIWAKKANAKVKADAVKTPDDFMLAGERLKALKEAHDAVEQQRVLATQDFFAAFRLLNDIFGRANKEFNDESIAIVNAKMTAYEAERERQARAEEAKLRELQAQEAKRIQEETEKQARAAEKRGDAALAQEIRENVPEPPPLVLVQRTPPKIEGLRRGETWVCVILDMSKLPDEFVERVPMQRTLDALARDRKGQNPPLGCRFEKRVIRGKTR